MLSVERKVGKPPKTGIYEWSPWLEKAGRTYTYWKACHHLKALAVPVPLSLKRIQQELNITSTSNSLRYIKIKFQRAKKDLHAIQQKAKEYREQHLHQLAEHYAEIRNSTKEQELKQIIRNEKLQAMALKH